MKIFVLLIVTFFLGLVLVIMWTFIGGLEEARGYRLHPGGGASFIALVFTMIGAITFWVVVPIAYLIRGGKTARWKTYGYVLLPLFCVLFLASYPSGEQREYLLYFFVPVAIGWFVYVEVMDRLLDAGVTGAYAQESAFTQIDTNAVVQLRLSAAEGNNNAQFSLGLMHAHGRGVRQDRGLAHMWFSLAAAKGNAEAAKSRDDVAKLMSDVGIAAAERRAQEWKRTAKR